MRKIVKQTITLKSPSEFSISVKKSDGTPREQSYPSDVTMYRGDEATITLDYAALLPKYDGIASAKLILNSHIFHGSPQLKFYWEYPTKEEYPSLFQVSWKNLPDFDFDFLGQSPQTQPPKLRIKCECYGSDDFAIVEFANPRVELTYETHYNATATKTLPVSKDAAATLYIPSGKTTLSVLDIHDPMLGFSLTHFSLPTLSPQFRTNLDETLSENGKVYTDALGFEHLLQESFYTLTAQGEKFLVTNVAATITAGADGRLWHRAEEVFRDLRSADGLHATSRLKGIKRAEWVEQRYEEEKQVFERLCARKDYLCSFVKVNEETGRITPLTQTTLSSGSVFESLYHSEGSFLTVGEAEQLLSVSSDITALKAQASLTEEEQERLQMLQAQHDLLLSRAKEYSEDLRARYVDYATTKAQLESLAESLPVTFLFSDEGAKGYNKRGALVTIQPKDGKALIVVREYYKIINAYCVTAVQDEDGNAMRFYYDISGHLSRVVNSLGEEAVFTYENDLLHTIKRPHAPTLTFGYTDNRITSVADEYTVSSFSFDHTGRLCSFSRETDVASVVHGTVTKGETVSLASLVLTHEEDSIRIVDHLKNREEFYSFTENFVTESCVLENGLVAAAECVSFDEETELILQKSIASPACLGIYPLEDFCWAPGTKEEYTYNTFHECVQTVTTQYTPDEVEQERTVTNTAYNEKGHPVRIVATRVLNATETSTEKTTVTIEEFFYNANDELVKTESYTKGKEHLLGRDIEEIFYDENGKETQRIVYNSLSPSDKLYTEQRLDHLGRVVAELDETGRFETKLSYIGDTARLRSVKNERGATVAYAYDKEGREVSVTASTEDGESNTESVYYTASLPVCSTNGRHVFNYTYDGKSRVTNIDIGGLDYLAHSYAENEDGTETVTTVYAGFEGVPLSVTSDKFGKVKSCVRPGIKNVSYSHTPDGRLSQEYDSVSERRKSYGYDENFRLDSYTDTLGVSEELSYDEEDRVIERKETLDGNTVTTDFAYDADTERLSHVTVKDLSILPHYDPMGRESKRTVWKNGSFLHGTYTTFAKYGDYATMRPSVLELMSSTDTHRFKYTYDESGNIERIYENGILSVRYEYDSLGRLTREDNRVFGKTTLWEYDKSGNILSRSAYPFTTKRTEALIEATPDDILTYEYAGDYLVSLNGTEQIHYCTEGHPDFYRGKTLTWLAPRMLGSFGDKVLTYNSDGLCSSINGKPLVYGRDGRLLSDGTFRYLYDESGALFGFLRAADGAEYLYRRDAQGNIIAILDMTGSVVVKYKYNAWGEHKILDASGEEITDPNHIGHLNPHRYRGYYYSTELGLYYLKSRFYDAEIGRFICADSLDYLDPHTVGGLNLYAYCNNNPVMNVDPTGHAWWEWAVAAVVVVACVAAATVTGGASLAGVALIGAAIGGTISIATQAVEAVQNGTDDFDMSQFVDDIVIGTVSAIIGGGAVSTLSSALGANAATLALSTEPAIASSASIGATLGVVAYESKKAAPRIKSNTRKKAHDKAFQKGGKRDPIYHPNGKYGPHFHPSNPKFKHWHYYFSFIFSLLGIDSNSD